MNQTEKSPGGRFALALVLKAEKKRIEHPSGGNLSQLRSNETTGTPECLQIPLKEYVEPSNAISRCAQNEQL